MLLRRTVSRMESTWSIKRKRYLSFQRYLTGDFTSPYNSHSASFFLNVRKMLSDFTTLFLRQSPVRRVSVQHLVPFLLPSVCYSSLLRYNRLSTYADENAALPTNRFFIVFCHSHGRLLGFRALGYSLLVVQAEHHILQAISV